MFLYLLTHERELTKKSNTGRLVVQSVPEYAKIITWKRKEPCPELIDKIAVGSTALLYPGENSEPLEEGGQFDSYILLDGTWQEAQKMYNKSSYLKTLPKVKITTDQISQYHMRRNQKEQGLCTAECAVELLKHSKEPALAEKLTDNFELFLGF